MTTSFNGTLYIFDFDSTFVRVEALDELARISLDSSDSEQKLAKIQKITEDTMNGHLSFSEAIKMRFEYMSPHAKHIPLLIEYLKDNITPSFVRNKRFFKKHSQQIYIISGGFFEYIWPIVELFHIPKSHLFANTFLYDYEGNIVSFDTDNPLSKDEGKVKLLTKLQFPKDAIIIGDGYTDYEVKKSGCAKKFVAFTENVHREAVVEVADVVVPNLDTFLSQEGLTFSTSHASDQKKVLLLEDIHPTAQKNFQSQGYSVERLSHSLSIDDLKEAIQDITLLGIRSKTTITKELLSEAKNLLAVGSFCIGTDQIDLQTCSDQGVAIFNAPYSNTRSVVELAIGEMVMILRRVFEKSTKIHSGVWDKRCCGAVEIRGKTLGIIGYGNIGSQLSILAESMGMQVYYYDIDSKLPLGNANQCQTMDELLAVSDVISVHISGTRENKGIIGAREFSLMKKGAIFLNLSRGHVVDIPALVEALKEEKLFGAAIDVYPDEPKKSGDPFISELQNLPNVILTPHIGGNTIEAQENIGSYVSSKLIEYTDIGSSLGSVNLPQLKLPALKGTHRLIHIHKNLPGVLADVGGALAKHSINISGQFLKTTNDIGYVITDVDSNYNEQILPEFRKIPHTIKVRVLY